MGPTTIRRAGSLLVFATLLASLAAATVTAPVSAAKPRCAGKIATIVGTNKGELIRGTPKNDVIVAKGGHDIVLGRGGNDIVCGNRGNDKLVGGGGNDLMFGQAGRDKHFGGPGRDRLVGGPANDSFNGGTGNDACLQGSGTGPMVNCERPPVGLVAPIAADLAVTVTGPTYLNPEPTDKATYTVRVQNNGPATTGYQLSLGVAQQNVICSGQEAWIGLGAVQAALASGQHRDHSYQMYCDDQVAPATSEVTAEVIAQVNDPVAANNKDSLITTWD